MDNNINISRRDALKRIGTAVIGIAAASTGVFSLTSCNEKKMKRIVLYFTGTGNSLYIARQIAGKDGEILSIPQLVKEGKYDIEADEIGIVYPIYGHMPPNMVRRFIQRANLKADYLFAVLTYGARKCNAVEIWEDISSHAGKKFDYISTIVMVDNWLPNFDMNEQVMIDKHIPENLQMITEDLASRKQWHEPVTQEERDMHAGFMKYSGINPETGFLVQSQNYFDITDACIGCSACVSVCPKGNYKMTSRGVSTQGECEFCFACIQNCPQKAIKFKKNEGDPLLAHGEANPNARYRNEHISLIDIKRANNQF